MKRLALILPVLFVLLGLATEASSAPITLRIGDDGGGWIGLGGASIDILDKDGDFSSPCGDVCFDINAEITLTAGPPTSVTTFLQGGVSYSRYVFDDAVLTITSDFGSFVAPVPNMVSLVNETTTCSECPRTVDILKLGPGLFDDSLAAALHVKPNTIGGDLNFYLEEISGGPLDLIRTGNLNAPTVSIYAESVPEAPQSVLLFFGLVATVAFMVRRDRATRRG